jgi:dolichol-phosphate mannosyltransferase
VLPVSVRDPLSGCFALTRAALNRVAQGIAPRGWKLLLDILAAAPDLSVAEIAMTFRARVRGRTKMNASVIRAWLRQLFELRRARRPLKAAATMGAPA